MKPLLFVPGLLCFLTACGREEIPVERTEPGIALKYAAEQANIVPRFSGSEGARKAAQHILQTSQTFRKEWIQDIYTDEFTDETPEGVRTFRNVHVIVRGKSKNYVIAGAHYDSKRLDTAPKFAAANDGGSGTGALLAVLKKLSERTAPLPFTVHFMFFDGEEALLNYTAKDGLHGSRHAAANLPKLPGKCKGMILLDMVGDSDLKLTIPENSSAALRALAHQAAADLDMTKHVADSSVKMLDDHVPFLEAGVPAIDLIDFEYGPRNVFWHTEADSIDKLSEENLRKSADLLLRMLELLR